MIIVNLTNLKALELRTVFPDAIFHQFPILHCPGDVCRIKEYAGFANIYFCVTAPTLKGLYSNTVILAWYLGFQVVKDLSASTIRTHMQSAKKVLEYITTRVCFKSCNISIP